MSQTNNIEKRTGYKETKLGWIPEDWEVLKVNEVFQFLGTNSFSRSSLFYSDSKLGTRNIHYGDIHSTYTEALLNGSNYEIIPVIKKDEKLNQNNDLLIDGDLIIADVSEDYEGVGKAIELKNIEGLNILAGLHTFALRDQKQKTINGFRSYIFLNEKVRNELKRIATGSKVYGISKNNLKKFEVIIPPLPEQKAIANCLSTWDTAITKLTALIKAKQLHKKALAQQLLTGKKRLKGFSEEWEISTYEELLKPVQRPIKWNDFENYHLISVRRRSGGLFHRESLLGEQILTKKLYTARTGDFLISKMQILHGASGLVSDEFDQMKISGSYIAVISRNKDLLSMEYLEWHSKTPYFYHQTYRSSYGVHIEKMTFNFKLFLKEQFIIPKKEEQAAIVQILNTADKEITLLQQQLQYLKLQKKGLMQQLLTGKKRLKVY